MNSIKQSVKVCSFAALIFAVVTIVIGIVKVAAPQPEAVGIPEGLFLIAAGACYAVYGFLGLISIGGTNMHIIRIVLLVVSVGFCVSAGLGLGDIWDCIWTPVIMISIAVAVEHQIKELY